VPLMIQCFPSGVLTAVVLSPATSLPANASEMAKQIKRLPDSTSGTTLSRTSGRPKLSTGGRPMTEPLKRPAGVLWEEKKRGED
jgi:hypothetical protein